MEEDAISLRSADGARVIRHGLYAGDLERTQREVATGRDAGARYDFKMQDRDLRDALREIAAAAGYEVTFEGDVQGKVGLWWKDISFERAFSRLASQNGLDWTQNGKTLKVEIVDAVPYQG